MPRPPEPAEHRARLRRVVCSHESLRDELTARVTRIQETEAIGAGHVVSEEDHADTRHYVALALSAFIDLLVEADLLIGPRGTWSGWQQNSDDDDDDWDDE